MSDSSTVLQPVSLFQKRPDFYLTTRRNAVTGGIIGPHYASSKSAMHGLIHWLSLRYAKDGIVSALDPVVSLGLLTFLAVQ